MLIFRRDNSFGASQKHRKLKKKKRDHRVVQSSKENNRFTRVSVREMLKVLDSRRPLTCAFRNWKLSECWILMENRKILSPAWSVNLKIKVCDHSVSNGPKKRFSQSEFDHCDLKTPERIKILNLFAQKISRGFWWQCNIRVVQIPDCQSLTSVKSTNRCCPGGNFNNWRRQ